MERLPIRFRKYEGAAIRLHQTVPTVAGTSGVQLYRRGGHDFGTRFPLIVASIATLPVRSCLIDGEAIISGDSGLAVFDLVRSSQLARRAAEGPVSMEIGKPKPGIESGKYFLARMAGSRFPSDWPLAYA